MKSETMETFFSSFFFFCGSETCLSMHFFVRLRKIKLDPKKGYTYEYVIQLSRERERETKTDNNLFDRCWNFTFILWKIAEKLEILMVKANHVLNTQISTGVLTFSRTSYD